MKRNLILLLKGAQCFILIIFIFVLIIGLRDFSSYEMKILKLSDYLKLNLSLVPYILIGLKGLTCILFIKPKTRYLSLLTASLVTGFYFPTAMYYVKNIANPCGCDILFTNFSAGQHFKVSAGRINASVLHVK